MPDERRRESSVEGAASMAPGALRREGTKSGR